MIIAIDGPAASGKGTLARRLAAHLGFAHLDTGRLYRAVGLKLQRLGKNGEDVEAATRAAKELKPADLDDPEIATDKAAGMASKVAAIPDVRSELIDFQRNFAHNPPGGAKGAVLDGRDIGTVICPDAEIKFFVVASEEARAIRRFEELKRAGHEVSLETVLSEMRARDKRDSERATARLVQAKDAHLLDTTNSDIDSVFQAALALVLPKIEQFRRK
jgi:cytidylate kinase